MFSAFVAQGTEHRSPKAGVGRSNRPGGAISRIISRAIFRVMFRAVAHIGLHVFPAQMCLIVFLKTVSSRAISLIEHFLMRPCKIKTNLKICVFNLADAPLNL